MSTDSKSLPYNNFDRDEYARSKDPNDFFRQVYRSVNGQSILATEYVWKPRFIT